MSDTKINIIGYSHVVPEVLIQDSGTNLETQCDSRPFLKNKKDFKFLSKQDSLALVAASKAWAQADIQDDYSDRTGIYLAVGVLPFEDYPLDRLAEESQSAGIFDMEKFSTDGYNSINPLMTFKCLPNMPLFHISHNLGITGRYFVTYPGIPQWFDALDLAVSHLNEGLIDYAVVGATADQRNFLVGNHIRRVNPDLVKRLVDSSSAMVLTSKENKKNIAQLIKLEKAYHPFDPMKSKEMLIKKDSYFPYQVGVCEPSLYFTLNMSNKTKGSLTYKCQMGDDNVSQIIMELI